jgi:hypothetical protein
MITMSIVKQFRIMNKPTPKSLLCFFSFLLTCCMPAVLFADSTTFDLVGPRIEMTVTRGTKTLPISKVADLQPGDKLRIRPEFPSDQSVHYLLIVAFLQGPTNPPPENWFTRADTWTKPNNQEGTVVTVPLGAEEALLFLAPETGGDFSTLRSTVRGRPGVFVRATQDLEQASLDRTRLDKYLEEIRETAISDPSALKKRSTLLAQTLQIKVDDDCFKKPLEQQSACLTQNSDQLVIDDAHNQSLVAAITSGASSDLITALGSSPAARGGYYSPYVGAVVDAARLMSSLHTATYQYIPALSLPEKDQLNLKLNSPPSFHNPKSVMVIGLPAVGLPTLPLLRPVDPKQVFCLQQSPLVMPVEGAPLVFSTALAHDWVLHLEAKSGESLNLPVTADASRGGFVIDTHSLHSAALGPKLTGTLRGFWGFSAFDGPEFQVRFSHPKQWTIPAADRNSLIVGRQSTLHLQSDGIACVENVVLQDPAGKDMKSTWKAIEPDKLEVEVPLKDEHAGQMKLKVKELGLANPDVVTLQAYTEAAHLEHFTINTGDPLGVLTGTHLDEVASLELNGVHFLPAKQSQAGSEQSGQEHSLELTAQNASEAAGLPANETLPAHATLKDGRVLDVQATIEPPRPKVTLVSENVEQTGLPSQVRFGKLDELPQDGKLSFFLKTAVPASFPRTEKIEVATTDGSSDTTLSVADGSLILQDSSSVLAVLDPIKAFGPGAFGSLRFRAVDADGAKGEWQSIATLVRIPTLKEVRCPDSPDKPCTLEGSNLFLLDAVASDPQFRDAVSVQAGYVSDALDVPRPVGTLLYIKLRDDPETVDTVALPVLPDGH